MIKNHKRYIYDKAINAQSTLRTAFFIRRNKCKDNGKRVNSYPSSRNALQKGKVLLATTAILLIGMAIATNIGSVESAYAQVPTMVTITSPLKGSQVTSGLVHFAGTASSGNPISRVELTIDGNLAGYQTATPKAAGDWSTWSIGYNIPVGSHWLVARVTDNMGKQAWNSITVVASASSAPPAVQITSPANNVQVTAGTVTFAGTASSGAGVAKVELTIDGNLAGYQTATPKAAGDWSTWSIGYNIPVGSHWLVARVTDNMGKQAWNSITVVASASSAPPAVQITSPANNVQVTAGTVTFAGTASSGAGVAKVELTIDGNATAYQTATPKAAGDWSTWSIGYNIPVGSHWLVARVTDNMGKQAWNSITVVASASSAPPAVQITSPANNVQVTAGTVTFAGTASSGAGVAKVELTIDGNATAYQTATPKAAGDWSTWSIGYNIPVGSHWLVARVTDNMGKQAWNSVDINAAAPVTPTPTPTTRLATGNSAFDQYDSLITASAQKYGFPDPMILKSQMSQESDFKWWVISGDIPCGIPSGWTAEESHSYGLMQITPACNPGAYALLPNGHPNLTQDNTSQYWPTSVFNPSYNVDFGANSMSGVYNHEKSQYPGCTQTQHLSMSLGAYNAGDGSIYGCGSWSSQANTYINYVLSKYQYLAGLAGVGYPF